MDSHPKPRSALRVCHLNLRSFFQRRSGLRDLCGDFHPDMFTLNETYLSATSVAYLPGFSFIRRDRDRRCGGLAIAFKDCLDVVQVPLPNDPDYALLAMVRLPNQPPLHIVTLHTSPFLPEHADLLAHLTQLHPDLIVSADLNCHHMALGDRTTTVQGRALLALLEATGLCHHPTPFTRFPDRVGFHPSCPDKLLTSRTLAPRIMSILSGYDVGSDHIPLFFDLKVKRIPYLQEVHPPPRTITDFKNADWAAFNLHIDTALHHQEIRPPQTPDQIDALADVLTSVIIRAKEETIPTKQVVHTQTRLPPDILKLIKQKRRVRRLLLKDPGSVYLHETYRALTQRVKTSVAAFKERKLLRICEKADHDFLRAPRTFWRLVKAQSTTFTPPSPLIVEGTKVTDPAGKAEAFRASLEKIHSIPEHPTFDPNFFRVVNEGVARHHDLYSPFQVLPPNLPDHPLTAPISPLDVSARLKTLRNTAPGPDGISNFLVKKAPASLIRSLAVLFTSILLMGYHPKSWKLAHVILLPKPQKNPRDPDNYRPISLTSSLSKLFEKILVSRLHNHLTLHNLIPSSQAGFRPGINMYDQILKVVTCLQHNSHRYVPTIMALMDVHKAFDTVWHDGLRAKLLKLHLPPSIIKWISNFLDGRTAQTRVRDSLSQPFRLLAGVPQGSAISPLLYIIYVRDLPQPRPRRPYPTSQGLAQFADDTAYWCSSRNPATLQTQLTALLTKYLEYCSRWRIRINASKTQLCYFNYNARKFLDHEERPITLQGTRLTLKRTCKYLGVTLDSKLSFIRHFKAAKKSASTRFKALRILNNRHQGCSARTLATIYTSMIRPVLTFAHPALTIIPHRYLRSFEMTERRAMRLAYHLDPRHSSADLYTYFHIPPLREFLNKLNSNYIPKAVDSIILHEFFREPFTSTACFSICHLTHNEF